MPTAQRFNTNIYNITTNLNDTLSVADQQALWFHTNNDLRRKHPKRVHAFTRCTYIVIAVTPRSINQRVTQSQSQKPLMTTGRSGSQARLTENLQCVLIIKY